jgi:hypothetical protein
LQTLNSLECGIANQAFINPMGFFVVYLGLVQAMVLAIFMARLQ